MDRASLDRSNKLLDLGRRALATPALDAPAALEILLDALLEAGELDDVDPSPGSTPNPRARQLQRAVSWARTQLALGDLEARFGAEAAAVDGIWLNGQPFGDDIEVEESFEDDLRPEAGTHVRISVRSVDPEQIAALQDLLHYHQQVQTIVRRRGRVIVATCDETEEISDFGGEGGVPRETFVIEGLVSGRVDVLEPSVESDTAFRDRVRAYVRENGLAGAESEELEVAHAEDLDGIAEVFGFRRHGVEELRAWRSRQRRG